MEGFQSGNSSIVDYLSDYIYTYFDIDNNTAVLILRFEEPSNAGSNLSNFTSSIFSKFLNTTRTGSAHKQSGISVQTFLSSILVSTGYFAIQVLLFSVLRHKLKIVYQSRLTSKHKENPDATHVQLQECSRFKRKLCQFFKGSFGWMYPVAVTPIEKYQDTVGLDAYFFLRFIRMLVILFLVLSIIHIPILIPIHYLSSFNEDASGINTQVRWLDRINMSNVVQRKSKMLIFHFLLALSAVTWFHFVLISELRHIDTISSKNQKGADQSLIYLDNIPNELKGDRNKLVEHFNLIYPEAAFAARFLPKNCTELQSQYKNLVRTEIKIETAAMCIVLEKYFSKAKNLMKQESGKSIKWYKKFCLTIEVFLFHLRTINRYFNFRVAVRWQTVDDSKISKRPNLKFQFDSFIRAQYECLDLKFKRYRIKSRIWKNRCAVIQNWDNSEYLFTKKDPAAQVYYDKAFVRFKSANMARIIGLLLIHDNIQYYGDILIAPNMKDIIWQNLEVSNPTVKFLRAASANILSVFIIVGYIVPIAFIALVSQIPYSTAIIPFLSQVSTQSKFLNDVLAGIVPIITLVFLTEFAPYIFRYFGYLRCKRTGAEIEIDTQRWFFAFLFVHVFLVVTISSGISFLIERLFSNPVTIPTLLANDLPKSSNFFCSFIVIRCLAYAGGNLLQLKELLFEIFYYRLTTYSPRTRLYRMKHIPLFQWGSTYPIFSVLGSIGIIYSIISPIILPLCCIGFSLVFFSLKCVYEFQYSGLNISETFGKLYPQALMQLYAGIYFMEFCMIGLFALSNNYKLCSCMVVAVILTIIAHFKLSHSYMAKPERFSLTENVKTKSPEYQERWMISIPFADGKLDAEINLPGDCKGIAKKEQHYIEQNYNIQCCIEQFSLKETGDIVCNYS